MTWVIRKIGRRRVRVTADRGFADVALFPLLAALKVAFVIRVKKSPKVWLAGAWRQRHTVRFPGHPRRRALDRLLYCARSPHALWITMSRARDPQGKWGIWYVVTNRPYAAEQAMTE